MKTAGLWRWFTRRRRGSPLSAPGGGDDHCEVSREMRFNLFGSAAVSGWAEAAWSLGSSTSARAASTQGMHSVQM
jgi:hypothetical protein